MRRTALRLLWIWSATCVFWARDAVTVAAQGGQQLYGRLNR